MSEAWVVFPAHPLSWVDALVQVRSHTAVCTDSMTFKSLICNDRMSYMYWELLLMVHSVSQTLSYLSIICLSLSFNHSTSFHKGFEMALIKSQNHS